MKQNDKPAGIDFNALAEALLRNGHMLSSKLVEFMTNRSNVTFQEVMDTVHGNERNATTIRTLVNRTNNALHALKSRLRFSTRASKVLRHIDPE
jgi:hypothetical protein